MGFFCIKTKKLYIYYMRPKEEHLDLIISCPFTGKHYWVRELDTELYPYFSREGYEWLFEYPTCEECGEFIDHCECDED